MNKQNIRLIFGLKLKQLRQQKGLSFADLSKASGLSVSYLNEIEKGKKYPKEDKIHQIADALEVSFAELTSQELSRNLEPVDQLLKSNFLNELPLDLFGIELSKVVEIIASAPVRVGAFISTLLELSRSHALKEENFYFGALRSYLELNSNYFPEIEKAAEQFCREHSIPAIRPIPVETLQRLLEMQYKYRIVENGLDQYPELQGLRSVFIPKRRELLLNSRLNPMQKAFQFGKEIAFQELDIKERAFTSSLLRANQFEEVLNHARATYFSVALHIPLELFVEDIRSFFRRDKWDGQVFLSIMRKYLANPEMYYHRLTNVLPEFFGLKELFFLRFTHDLKTGQFDIDRELHLSRRHHPHSTALLEHYCRRWKGLKMLEELHKDDAGQIKVGVQRSRYIGTEDEYLCLTIARPSYPDPHKNVSVTLGLLVTEALREKVGFLDDPDIPFRMVNNTCERCSLTDCAERAAPPTVADRRQQIKAMQKRLQEL
ncbi:MAG: helix-turn-helix domain-containing protein [Lewinella sp.]|nr:helix-turn-helix domain-containing protein [Lewinella sp.]